MAGARSLSHAVVTDPVEGGSANDYDYVAGDPINNLDLDGSICVSLRDRKRCHIKDALKGFRGALEKGAKARVLADNAIKCLDNHSNTPNACPYSFLDATHAWVSGPFDPVYAGIVKVMGRLGGYFGCGNLVTSSARTLTSMGEYFANNGDGIWIGVGLPHPYFVPRN